MKTIKAKNGEWVNLNNHLTTVTKLEGKEFAIAVATNSGILKASLKHLEGILAPSPEFAELTEKAKPYQGKTDKKSEKAMQKLEKDNAKIIEARKKQIDDANKLLAEDFEIELMPISTDMYPDKITAEQVTGLLILR
tara:strand:+ start:55 stop:465 length:411 start_codon:yes stop_codon:yes gene_type:complete